MPAGGSSKDRDTAIAPAGAPPSVDFDAILTSLGATDQRLPLRLWVVLAQGVALSPRRR
jgi:hypothetical protein